MNVFSRPLFKNQFIRRYAEGGIVSTVAEPQVDPNAMLQDFAGQVDATENSIDSANNMDEILSGFSGEEKTVEGAREELAEIVGKKDAMATPESVLALVQPAMEIMKMSQQMAPAGGIGDVPLPGAQAPMMGVQTPEGFTPAQMQAEPFQPMAGFSGGGLAEYVQDYKSARTDPALAGLGYDEGEYWTALGLLGAGLAQGKTVAQGLSMGTQLYSPYLQEVRKGERAEKLNALDYALKARQSDKEAAAAAAAADTEFERDLILKQLEIEAKDDRPQSAKEADEYLIGQGIMPGSEEYKKLFPETLKLFAVSPGTTVNMGDKLGGVAYKNQLDAQTKRIEAIDADGALAESQGASAETISSIVQQKGEGNFTTGVGAPTRALVGDALSLIGFDPKKVPLVGDPAQADVLEAETARLGLAEAQNLARVTNLQVEFAKASYPQLTRTPKGNLILAEMVRRRADRAKKLRSYKDRLMNTYQHINPTYLPDPVLAEVLPGFNRSTFVGPDAESPFDANGKPIMNFDDYMSYLDRTEPLFDDKMKTLITETVATSPSKFDTSQFGSLFSGTAPAPNPAAPTVGEVIGTPGVDPSGAAGEEYKGDFINRGGKPMKWNPQKLQYEPYTGAQ